MGAKIGLALSGGGFRASVFHLGLLARLADEGLLEDVTAISTVSGGTLAIGLVYAANGYRWPTNEEYRSKVVPHTRKLLTTFNLQSTFLKRMFTHPLSLFRPRARDVSKLMQEHWGITARLNELALEPLWLINATCFETGVNWRFSPDQMGDYLFGYSSDTGAVTLSDAMASSAAFPGLIGPLDFDVTGLTWTPYGKEEPVTPEHKKVHLWDGGLYENLGVEALFKPGKGYQHGVEFLITSDAGAKPGTSETYSAFKSGMRMISLATNQTRALRARMITAYLQDGNPGSYMQIDNSATYLLGKIHRKDLLPEIAPKYLPEPEVIKAALMGSTLRELLEEEYERLFRQGFEVADLTMFCFKSGGKRPLRGYKAADWA